MPGRKWAATDEWAFVVPSSNLVVMLNPQNVTYENLHMSKVKDQDQNIFSRTCTRVASLIDVQPTVNQL